MDATTRAALRTALVSRYPWLGDPHYGPAAVEAGECDECGAEARMIMTCGPGSGQYLGRDCLVSRGGDAFCEGHGDLARPAVAWMRALPAEADLVARLWWVSTGEVRLQPEQVRAAVGELGLPAEVSA